MLFDGPVDRVGNDRLSRLRHTVEAGGEIGRDAGYRVVRHALWIFLTLSGDDHVATRDAYMDRENPTLLGPKRRHCPVGFKGGANRPNGIVAMGDGGAKQRHHLVADMAMHRAAMVFDDPIDGVENKAYQPMEVLRVECVR